MYNEYMTHASIADINECLVSAMSGVTRCTSPMFCVNMPGDAGKYSCQCPEGTIQAGNTCGMCGCVGSVCSKCGCGCGCVGSVCSKCGCGCVSSACV